MNKKRGGMLLVGVGLLMALIAGWLVYAQLEAAKQRTLQVPGRRVVVATQDIPERGRIALNQVTLATVSEESLPARPYSTVDEAVGKFARQRIFKGDILTEDRTISLDQIRTSAPGSAAPGSVVMSPSFILDKDQVMIVLPANLHGGFAGQGPNLLTASNALRAGDYVDVLVTMLEPTDTTSGAAAAQPAAQTPVVDNVRTRVWFQNLPVYQIGTFPASNPTGNPGPAGIGGAGPSANPEVKQDERYLIFVVDRETALELKWLKDIVALGQANVDFVLRSPANQEVQQTNAVTVQDIRRQFGVGSSR